MAKEQQGQGSELPVTLPVSTQAAAVPTVAPRNDPKPLEPYAHSRASEVANLDPAFAYQWIRKDQLEAKCREHEIGHARVGFYLMPPWERVERTPVMEQGRARDDSGKPIDKSVTNGDLVLCRMPKAEHAKYADIERRMDVQVSQRLHAENMNFGSNTTVRTRVVGGRDGVDADIANLTQRAS